MISSASEEQEKTMESAAGERKKVKDMDIFATFNVCAADHGKSTEYCIQRTADVHETDYARVVAALRRCSNA